MQSGYERVARIWIRFRLRYEIGYILMKFYNTHVSVCTRTRTRVHNTICKLKFTKMSFRFASENQLEDQPCDHDRENEHYHERLAPKTTVFVMLPMSKARKLVFTLFTKRNFSFFYVCVFFQRCTLTNQKEVYIIESTRRRVV